ncbi:hypothetical protein MNBD_GAMMA08-768 [hydrothermal vent metagenome]|uniref:SoxXA-binding protein n=1 Tax=hydrothermal vent metagenome TaxID=652676 RepID=A0A3B0X7V6_9ZZZZ
MNHAKIFAGVALAFALMLGSAHASSSEAEYKSALTEAKTALNNAKKVQFLWRDSGKILKKADKAAKSGDFAKATKLANKAKRQGELALLQSKEQANAGPY